MSGVGNAFTSEMGRDQFMHLLVTQMRNQNPLDPISDSDFIAQLAQFSTLEGIEKLNANFSDMLALQQLTQGANLVGKTVLYEQPDAAAPAQGVVGAVQLQNGKLHLVVDHSLVPLDRVRGLAAPRP